MNWFTKCALQAELSWDKENNEIYEPQGQCLKEARPSTQLSWKWEIIEVGNTRTSLCMM